MPLAEARLPILFLEPSCYSAVRDDHPHLVGGELAASCRRVAAVSTFEEWAGDVCERRRLLFRPGPATIALHAHCHQRALVGSGPALDLLRRVPGAELIDLDAGCCGMAGSFGYERRH